MRHYILKSTYLLLTLFVGSHVAIAQSFLRDAETEAFFREISDPIFIAADLNPTSVNMYLLAAKDMQAFVTGGQNIFIHSGLIIASDDVNQLLGVIAHETAHIANGNSVTRTDAAKIAGNTSILSMVLGAAAILAGSPDAGMGLFMAGQSVARGQFFAHTRVEESTADQSGAAYLERTGTSGQGLSQFFEKLRHQEILAQVRQDPYVRTHPLNSQRILALQKTVATSPYFHTPPNPVFNEKFNRIKAKLIGYLYEPSRTLKLYPLTDKSTAARYARVYAYHKALEWDLALAEADALIAVEPDNGYFYEIKGQILFENGRVRDALPVFKKAVEFAPNQPLVSTALGQAMVSLEDDQMMKDAIPILEHATRVDSGNSFAWFNLAKAYSWSGQEAEASLATAERFYSIGAAPQAMQHARHAMSLLATGTPQWLRAQDIFFVSQEAVERYERNQRRRRASGLTFQATSTQ